MITKTYRTLNIRPDTFELVTKKCVEEYIRHHPEMKKIKITNDKIVHEICNFYLNN